jgi:hypothetical protein
MLASVVVIGAYVNAMYINPSWNSPVAVEGDSVEVRYVGSYGGYYYEEGAVIFDTNMENINNSSSYIKSPSYTNKTKFDLLKFEVGGDDVLAGFGNAVIGKLINWTAEVVIPSDEGYGVSQKFDYNGYVVYKINGTMSLKDFNSYASSDIKDTDLENPMEVKMPNGLTAVVNRSGVSDVTYTYIGLEDGATGTTNLDKNVNYTLSDIDATTFKLTYECGERMYKVAMPDDIGEKIAFVDDFDTKGVFKWKDGSISNSDKEEQKGEKLYFWIEIVDINNYRDD